MKRTALVVGAAGGVGSATAGMLIDAGYDVLGTVLDDEQAGALKRSVPGLVETVSIDLADAESVGPTLSGVLERHGATLEAVVTCAAVSPYGPLETTPLAGLRRTLEINSIANVAVYQAAMPYLRRTRGRIVLVSSMAGKVAFPFIGHYAASKFALEALGDVMRREAGKWGIEVILVEPGGIRTTMVTEQMKTIVHAQASLSESERQLYGALYAGFADALQKGYAQGVEPQLVARTICDALSAPQPQPRYQVGDDAKFFCGLAMTKPDRELDAIATFESATSAIEPRAAPR
jgi:NAD(P)-dependent dehydrogenase (short-subunit alcohol dehydrogenase family)